MELAKCNQEEFIHFGGNGKCIEARELIIALPKSFVDLDMEQAELLKRFTEAFHEKYGVHCVSSLHHNKTKTNYHIHLIFSERELLQEPIVKVASRNMFYDESGKHCRTKKEILDEEGKIREGCKIIAKGEVYEKKIFDSKRDIFKTKQFTRQVKEDMTTLINTFVQNDKEKLKVFDKEGIYLATKKIGKNNPMEQQIREMNAACEQWNDMADTAILSGIASDQIKDTKREQISKKIADSIQENGDVPNLYIGVVRDATRILHSMIMGLKEKWTNLHEERLTKNLVGRKPKKPSVDKNIPSKPQPSQLAKNYEKYDELHKKLYGLTTRYLQLEQQRQDLEERYSDLGFFDRKKKAELSGMIADVTLKKNAVAKKRNLLTMKAGFKSVEDFEDAHRASRSQHFAYIQKLAEWESQYLTNPDEAETTRGSLTIVQKLKRESQKEPEHSLPKKNRKREESL